MKFSKKQYKKLKQAKYLQGIVVKQKIKTSKLLIESSRK